MYDLNLWVKTIIR